jgi:cellulose synthase/poly-beta-1,6-N-acetylglucosamine synthase-like glycosyltransferase
MVPLRTRASDLLGSVAFLGLSGALLAFNYYTGFLSMSLYVDLGAMALAVVFLEAEVALLSFATFIALSGLVFLFGSVRTCRIDHAADAGRVTAIVPVYRDAGVLDRSVESLLDCGYRNLEVVIVVEPDDRESRARAEELAADDRVEVLVNTRAPGSKAGAINHALAETDGPYVAVFDADERVHERFLPAAVGRLRAGTDIVQGRTVPEPTGLIESVAYYESVLLNYVALRPLYALTGFRMAASRAVVCRRGALTAVGGYDERMLTEDFAFAHECYRERLSVTELLSYPSRIDAAHSLRDWWGQRKRWMTGYAQVLHRLLGSVRPVSDYHNPLSAVIGAATVVGSLFMLTLLSKAAVLLVVGSRVGLLAPLAVVAAVSYLIRWHDYRRGLVPRPTWHGLLVPLVLPVYSLAAIKAVFEYLFSWRGEWYRVSKEA